VIIREAHALGMPTYIFFTVCWTWVVEWDLGVTELLLLPSRIDIHTVYIQCIISISFMCR